MYRPHVTPLHRTLHAASRAISSHSCMSVPSSPLSCTMSRGTAHARADRWVCPADTLRRRGECREGARRLSSNASDLRSEDRLESERYSHAPATAPARRPGRAQHHAQHGQHCLPTRATDTTQHGTLLPTAQHCLTTGSELHNPQFTNLSLTIHNHMRRSTDQGRRGWSAVDQRSRVPRARGCRGVWYWGGT